MEKKYWTKKTESFEWILRCYMERTDYIYHHTDLGMLDIDFADLPEDERLDGATEAILSEHPEEVLEAYAQDMALFLDGFFNMPANGRYKSCINEGKVTDLSEKEGFNALFVNADRFMAKEFIEKGGHAWDGILNGYPLRFIKDWNGGITLMQTTSDTEHKRFYKIRIARTKLTFDKNGEPIEVPRTPVLFALSHSACEIPIEGVEKKE